MAWVTIVPDGEATGALREMYDNSSRRLGDLPELMTVFSLRPELLEVRQRLSNVATFGGSGLGRYREELIAVSISAALGCRF